MKVGDRVITHMDEHGVIENETDYRDKPFEWLVRVDGDKVAYPYMEQELEVET